MARNIEDIQRDIERTRRQLAGTLDELAERSKPENITARVKTATTEKLQDPTVQKVIAGVGALVVGGIVFATMRGRRRKKDLQEIRRMLAESNDFSI